MNKILLVYDDYTELMNAETSLKKIGFDVIGLTNEYSLAEQVLSFNPDAVVGFGAGSKVNSSSIGKKLKEMGRWQGKVILIYDPRSKPDAPLLIRVRADIVLETPVPPVRLVQVLAKLLKFDEATLIEKLNKVMQSEATRSDVVMVPGDSSTIPEDELIIVPGHEGQKNKSLFGFGKNLKDLYEDETAQLVENSESLFADVDLKEIEFELTGGKSEQRPPSAFNIEESNAEAHLALKSELKKAQDAASVRVSKYRKLIESVSVSPVSTVRRVDARKRQKLMQKDMDLDNLKSNDELRREFTKALFKK